VVATAYDSSGGLFTGKIPSTGLAAGHVLALDQRFPVGWIDLSLIPNGPGVDGAPAAEELGMAASGNIIVFNALDALGDIKQLTCTEATLTPLSAVDCAESWTTLPPSP
jgi:hypothetical protein